MQLREKCINFYKNVYVLLFIFGIKNYRYPTLQFKISPLFSYYKFININNKFKTLMFLSNAEDNIKTLKSL